MRRGVLATRYIVFALISVSVNILTQRAVFQVGRSEGYLICAIALGTLAGLVVKYALDKRWIFVSHRRDAVGEGGRFLMYAITGLATTTIFWVLEVAFWLAWETDFAREAGAIIGLSIGYACKYQLDSRLVFTEKKQRDAL